MAYANQRKVSWGTSANKVNERSPYDSRFVRERGQPIVSASNSPLGCCVFRACDTYRPFCPLLLRRQRTWDEVSRPFPKTRVYFWIIRFSSLLLIYLTPPPHFLNFNCSYYDVCSTCLKVFTEVVQIKIKIRLGNRKLRLTVRCYMCLSRSNQKTETTKGLSKRRS